MKIDSLKKYIFLFTTVFVFMSYCNVQAQSDSLRAPYKVKHGVYLELFGSGGFYSINYERLIQNNFSLRLGGAYVPNIPFGKSEPSIVIPASVSTLFHSGKSTYIEFGVGGTIVFFNELDGHYINAILGLRGQDNLGEGTFFRLSFLPGFDTSGDMGLFFWGGLSVGYSFN